MTYPPPEDILTSVRISEILRINSSLNIGLNYYSERAVRAKTFLIDLDDFNQEDPNHLFQDFCEKLEAFGSSLMPYDEILIPSIDGVNIAIFKHNFDIVVFSFHKFSRNAVIYEVLTPAIITFEYPIKTNFASLIPGALPEVTKDFLMSVAKTVAVSLSLINQCKTSRRVVTEMPRSLHPPGTPEHRQDIFAEYRICEINPFGDPPAPIVAVGSTKASPRAHERRGHFRTLASGKIISIRPTLVGDPSRGAILKDYRVTSKQEPV